MGAFYEIIPPSLLKWIVEQKVFWVATAPLSSSGHINISPKGGQYFGILNPTTFWYLDLTGSGIETLSHLHEPGNGRITVMFNAFEGPPQIVRLWGKGEVLEYGSKKYEAFVDENKVHAIAGTRAVILVHIHQVGSSCGFSMPFFDFKAFRPTLNEFFEKRVAAEQRGNKKDGIERYWAFKNAQSMDGLPGMRRGVETAKKENVKPIKKMVGPYAPSSECPRTRVAGQVPMLYLIIVALLSFCIGIAGTALVGVQLGYLQR
ncbi:pyridoxamine phosphate oxidase family protein [Hyaloscypha variabilis]